MRLIELTLRDFGVFKGVNTINLEPRNGSIIIFGGKNGAGKTTLLEGIRLCLYGSRALGNRVSRRVYEEYIENQIHNQRKGIVPTKYASVSILFEYAQFGSCNHYEVTRAWEKKANSIDEQLFINKDGDSLTGIAEDKWQDFIEDIIPVRVSNLFFFDGEKIQSLANDSFDEQALGEEINRLLGLDIIDKLQSDLDIYLYKQRREQAIPELINDLKDMQLIKDSVEAKFNSNLQDRANTQMKIDQKLGEIENLERRIHQESSGFALTRDELKQELSQVEANIDQTEREIQKSASGLMPFTLLPTLSKQLEEQLKSETKVQQLHAAQQIIEKSVEKLKSSYHSEPFWQDTDTDLPQIRRNKIIQQLDDLLVDVLEINDSEENIELIHQVSESEGGQLLFWINQSLSSEPEQVVRNGKRLEELVHQRTEIITKLRKVPDDEILKPFMEKLNSYHQKLGELNGFATQQDKELSSLENQSQESHRNLKKAFDALRGGNALERRLNLVVKTKEVLKEFLDQFTEKKVAELEILITARFNELSRKPDLIKYIKVNVNKFGITIFDVNDKPLPKSQLSAGEKQMFAIATLWALRQLSGRPFPIIIDTPLGRLDSDHRKNLVEQYFPYVSHQLILLSTDTEVDQEYFKALKPFVSSSYHLDYDTDIGATKISSGYFWNEVANVAE